MASPRSVCAVFPLLALVFLGPKGASGSAPNIPSDPKYLDGGREPGADELGAGGCSRQAPARMVPALRAIHLAQGAGDRRRWDALHRDGCQGSADMLSRRHAMYYWYILKLTDFWEARRPENLGKRRLTRYRPSGRGRPPSRGSSAEGPPSTPTAGRPPNSASRPTARDR